MSSRTPAGHVPAHPFDTLRKADAALNPWGFVLWRFASPAGGYFRILADDNDALAAIATDWSLSHEYFGNVHKYEHTSPDEWQSSIRDFLVFALQDGRLQ